MLECYLGHVNVDLVGPLPPSCGLIYLFTVVESDVAADVARAFIRVWVARFGVPSDILSDGGLQFTSTIWGEIGQSLRIRLHRTTT